MKRRLIVLALFTSLAACGSSSRESEARRANVLELGIDGMSFVGPGEIKSGWTTVRVRNDSGLTHFGLVYRLPDGVTAEMLSDEVVKPIQHSLTANIEGRHEDAARIAATIPLWIGDITYMGGPGMMSDGVTGEATMFLTPGNYIVECYVKTNGVQHNYHPRPGMHGMVLPLTVLDEDGGMAEPDANVTLNISNAGYEIADGAFRPGENSVRVNFVEQRLYNNFVGHDAHLFRIDSETDVERSAAWVDFFPNDGQQTPAPARFVGGIHDMPEGATGYFKVDLAPGKYGIVAEVPDAQETGLFTTIEVPGGETDS